jgi:hypothetical protein
MRWISGVTLCSDRWRSDMSKAASLPPRPRVRDPRTQPAFQPARLPQANGGAAPAVGTRDSNERIKIQFLSVYYYLNINYADLLQIRASQPGSERDAAEHRILRRIERALRQRDALEDHYAPLGILAEPVMHHGFAMDLQFTFGTVNAQGRPRSEGLRMSGYMALPRRSDPPNT